MKTVLLAYEREQDLNAVEAMLKAGAQKVLTKEKAVDELYDAIKRAAA